MPTSRSHGDPAGSDNDGPSVTGPARLTHVRELFATHKPWHKRSALVREANERQKVVKVRQNSLETVFKEASYRTVPNFLVIREIAVALEIHPNEVLLAFVQDLHPLDDTCVRNTHELLTWWAQRTSEEQEDFLRQLRSMNK